MFIGFVFVFVHTLRSFWSVLAPTLRLFSYYILKYFPEFWRCMVFLAEFDRAWFVLGKLHQISASSGARLYAIIARDVDEWQSACSYFSQILALWGISLPRTFFLVHFLLWPAMIVYFFNFNGGFILFYSWYMCFSFWLCLPTRIFWTTRLVHVLWLQLFAWQSSFPFPSINSAHVTKFCAGEQSFCNVEATWSAGKSDDSTWGQFRKS